MLSRREFVVLFGGAAIASSMQSTTSGAGAQRTPMPVVGYFNARSPHSDAHLVAATAAAWKRPATSTARA